MEFKLRSKGFHGFEVEIIEILNMEAQNKKSGGNLLAKRLNLIIRKLM